MSERRRDWFEAAVGNAQRALAERIVLLATCCLSVCGCADDDGEVQPKHGNQSTSTTDPSSEWVWCDRIEPRPTDSR